MAALDTDIVAGWDRQRIYDIIRDRVATHEDFTQNAKQAAPEFFADGVQTPTKARGAQVVLEVAVRDQKATS